MPSKLRTYSFVAILASALFLTGCLNISSDEEVATETPSITFTETEYDFGLIKQSGGKVIHEFNFTYQGDAPIEITGVPTSCACTSAVVDKTKLNPGDSGILTAKFNPNLHEEPEGKFFKTITLLTEPKLEDRPEIKIWVEIDLDLGPEAYELQSDHDEEEEEDEGLTSYTSITSEKLSEMLANKDFTLIDVHIPEQEHIEGTDLFIPYNKIEDNPELPTDKNTKIVLYCRSGGMSRAAAYTLAEEGYTNIYDLVGGKNAYDKFMESVTDATDLQSSTKEGHIEAEAIVLNERNIAEIDVNLDANTTSILLTLDNHRESLAEHDYQKNTKLDDTNAEKWTQLTSAMGGHHVSGILTFPKAENPENPEKLTISNLSVGNITLPFNL